MKKPTPSRSDRGRPAPADKPGSKPGSKLGAKPSSKSGGKSGGTFGVKPTGKPGAPRRKPAKPRKPPVASDPNGPMRLNRYIAHAGICSRREADVLITSGVVTVNGEVVTELGRTVLPSDHVQVGTDRIRPEAKRYVLLNKPRGFITTLDDPQGRRTVMELVKNACKERLVPVGRLDRDTTGLLLFTNDGDLADRLTHPRNGVRKLYHVTLAEKVQQHHLDEIQTGFVLDDGFVKADQISFAGNDPHEVGIELHSGRNRIVRRIFEHFGYKVAKLDRVRFAHLTKKDLPRGHFRHLSEEEVNFLRMNA